MLKTNIISLLFAALVICFPAFSANVAAQDNFVQNEIIVKLANTGDLTAIASRYGLNALPLEQLGNRAIYRLRVANNLPVSQVVALLRNDLSGKIMFAEPNYVISSPTAGNAPWSLGGSWSVGGSWAVGGSVKGYSRQWMRNRIELNAAHQITRGNGVKIAVLDTGIDLTHPIFEGKLLPGYDFVDNDNNPSEVGVQHQGAYGHGTHVAGIVAMVAPEAKIIPIRVLDQNGLCDVWRLTRALMFAANPDGDPSTDDGADIINLSLGTQQKTSLLAKIVGAETNDGTLPDDDDFPGVRHPSIVIVAAAGNTANETKMYPAAEHDIRGLIAVGASNMGDTLSGFSTHGDWLDVIAPGERIVSSIPEGRFGTWQGTSMSAPIVSGIAALVRAKFPYLNGNQIEEQIEATCEPLTPHRVSARRAVTFAP
jgi:thermitase